MAAITTLQGNNLETVYLVWLDALVNKSKENIDAQQRIRSIINHLKLFNNVKDCKQYLNETSKDDRILLIVSGQLGEEIIPRIHDYRQIFSIYVYCMNKTKNEQWAKHFPKIKAVTTELDTLLNQIQLDQSQRIKNKVDEPFITTISKLNEEFVYSQLLIDCLFRMKPNLVDKIELINLCKKFYENNPQELNLIKEFEETYSSNRALWWYTRDSFLYRLLNKALYIQNIDVLFLFQFFLCDIEQQLKQFQCSSTIRVYHGQLMSLDELNQLKVSIGEYILISTFFSTNLNRQQEIQYLNEYSFSHNLQKILFEIVANPQLDNLKPFANINSMSFYSNKQDILFMCGSIFRLRNIKQDINGLWIIEMTLAENINNNETNLISFGNTLYQMGKYDLAEKYFQQLLKDLPYNHSDISKCYHSLGLLALMKDNYDLSLEWHEKSLKILKSSNSCLADSYHCIGCIYQKKEDDRNALEFYNKALNIWTDSFGEDYYQIANCLNNMGCVYERQKKYSKALECHQKALLIRKKCLPENHLDLGASYNNIGNVYCCLEQYDLALKNYKYSFEIKTKARPSQYSSLASTLENIGFAYERKQSYEQALEYYEKAAKTFREISPSTHNHVIEIEQNISRIRSMLNPEKLTTYF